MARPGMLSGSPHINLTLGSGPFAPGEELEFQRRDLAAALSAYEELAELGAIPAEEMPAGVSHGSGRPGLNL